jgi:hypothetical protein
MHSFGCPMPAVWTGNGGMLNHAKIARWLRRQARHSSLSAPKPAAKNNRRKHPDKLRGDEGHDTRRSDASEGVR